MQKIIIEFIFNQKITIIIKIKLLSYKIIIIKANTIIERCEDK
jgi:hypothetical protein